MTVTLDSDAPATDPTITTVAQLRPLITRAIDPARMPRPPVHACPVALVRRWATARIVVLDVPSAEAFVAAQPGAALRLWRGDLPTVVIYGPFDRDPYTPARAVGATHLLPEGDRDPHSGWLEYIAALIREA